MDYHEVDSDPKIKQAREFHSKARDKHRPRHKRQHDGPAKRQTSTGQDLTGMEGGEPAPEG